VEQPAKRKTSEPNGGGEGIRGEVEHPPNYGWIKKADFSKEIRKGRGKCPHTPAKKRTRKIDFKCPNKKTSAGEIKGQPHKLSSAKGGYAARLWERVRVRRSIKSKWTKGGTAEKTEGLPGANPKTL